MVAPENQEESDEMLPPDSPSELCFMPGDTSYQSPPNSPVFDLNLSDDSAAQSGNFL